MLSIEKDFHWTCTAMDYPLYAFKFESNKYVSGTPCITVDVLINIKKDIGWMDLHGIEGNEYQLADIKINSMDFYECAKQLIGRVL